MKHNKDIPQYRESKKEVGTFLLSYQNQVMDYTKQEVEKVVSDRLKEFVPESLEQGIKEVQEFIAGALDKARAKMDSAIEPRVPVPFSRKKFSYFDAGVVKDTRNKDVIKFFYSYLIMGIVGETIQGIEHTEYYEVDKRYWEV